MFGLAGAKIRSIVEKTSTMVLALSYVERSFYYKRRFPFLCSALKCTIYFAFIELN